MTSRDRTILLGLALVGVLAGFWFFALKPKRAEVKEIDAQIATQHQRLQAAQATLATALKAKSETQSDHAVVAELGHAVPADDDLPSLLYELDSVAHNADVDFRAMSRGATAGASAAQSAGSPSGSSSASSAALPPGAVVGAAGLATLPFGFDFAGSFSQLERFLGDVHDFVQARDGKISVRGRLLTIDGVSLVPDDKELSTIKAKLAATAYLAPNDTPSSSGAADPSTTTGTGSAPAAASTTPQTTNSIAEGLR